MQDSPLGVRFADYVSAFPAGGTIAASWDRGEIYRRGYQMGQEHRGKGVDVQLGPVVGPIGRNPKGGVSSVKPYSLEQFLIVASATGRVSPQTHISLVKLLLRLSAAFRMPVSLLARSTTS